MSLAELVTTLGIVSVLSAMTMGTVVKAKTHAGRVRCLNRLRHLYPLMIIYTQDHGGRLPRIIGGRWIDDLVEDGYLGPMDQWMLRCPADPTPLFRSGYMVSYAGNCWLHRANLAGIDRPASRMLLGDMGDDIHGLSVYCARDAENFGELGFRHGGRKANFLFPDGHTESIKRRNISDYLWADDTTFPNN